MPTVNIVIESEVSDSLRCRQVSALFDVPANEKQKLFWKANLPLEEFDWSIGLIVGPSGSGKSTVARELFGDFDKPLVWREASVLDDFGEGHSLEEITNVCSAVGFNTIPAWLRPYSVLSNGEKFRIEMARRLLESKELLVVDEFTSVVDRQVAKIASFSIQKIVRKQKKRMVAVSCHDDIVDWLNPDWIFTPADCTFRRREARRRPLLHGTITPVHRAAWQLFAPYHYMSRELNNSARCFVLSVENRPAAFCGVIHKPVSRGATSRIFGVSRLVTLPDFQGLGLAFVLLGAVGSWYAGRGDRLHMYPAHPQLVRAMSRSAEWKLLKAPKLTSRSLTGLKTGGGRPCAVFSYVGKKSDLKSANKFLA